MGKKTPPSAPAPDTIARRIQARRKELGWSLADLAREAGLKSPSYVFYIERGEKAPSEDVAARLALALGEDVDAFVAWARLRAGGGALDDALASARVAERAVRTIESDPRHTTKRAQGLSKTFEGLSKAIGGLQGTEASSQRLRLKSFEASPRRPFLASPRVFAAPMVGAPRPIPLLEEGADPAALSKEITSDLGSGTRQLRNLWIAVEEDEDLGERLRGLIDPFAYELSRFSARRAPFLLPPGFYAILDRGEVARLAGGAVELEPHEAYAVRVDDAVELGFVHWDGQRLALLPHTNAEDLVIRPATSRGALAELIVGKVAIAADPGTVRVT